MNDEDRLQTLFEGVFAGNIFDLVPSFFTLPCLPTRQLISQSLQGSFDTLKLFEQVCAMS